MMPISLVTGFAACSARTPHFPVRGTVELDGKPMAVGEVHFKIPAAGTIEQLPVRNGSFSGSVARAGEHRVEIYSFRQPNLSKEQLAALDPLTRVTAQQQVNIVTNGNGFSADVKADGDNNYSFSVVSVKP